MNRTDNFSFGQLPSGNLHGAPASHELVPLDRTPGNRALRLLVIDDDPATAEFIRMIGDEVGFLASAFTTGIDFRLEDGRSDLYVIDLQMPGRDGIEVIRELAVRHEGAAVLLVSGLGDRMLATASKLAAAHGLRVMGALAKPFPGDSLFEALALALRNLRTRVEPPVSAPTCVGPEELKEGILANQIAVVYQPIVSVSTGFAIAMEALARWRHPCAGVVLPGLFVPVAERHNLSSMLDCAVLEIVIDDAKAHFARYGLPVSVNFSADDFSDLTLPDRIDKMLQNAGIPPEMLVIELTESSMIQDLPRALDTLMRLRMKGIGLWLDDFGTGYSSMEQLQRLPMTAVKIDRSFMPTDENWVDSSILLESLINLAQKLGITVIAEGAETARQMELLRRLGCDQAQGFHLGSPMSIDAFTGWLKASANQSYKVIGSR